MSGPPKKLSVIIPVYNERDTIEEVIRRVLEVDVGLEREVIVLDGKSTDGTRECLAKVQNPEVRVVLEEKRGGKGAAVRRGFGEAVGEALRERCRLLATGRFGLERGLEGYRKVLGVLGF